MRIAKKMRKAHMDKRSKYLQKNESEKALRELALANMYINKLDESTKLIKPDYEMQLEAMAWSDIKKTNFDKRN